MNFNESNIDGYNVIEYDKMNIYIIEKIFEDEFCEELVDIINKIKLQKTDYREYNNVRCFTSSITDLLNENYEYYYSFSTNKNEYNKLLENVKKNNIITNNLNGITKKYIININEKINEKMKILSKIIKKKTNTLNIEYNSGYILRKIYGATREHYDGVTEIYNSNIMSITENYLNEYRMIRNASIIFSLNDDYEGGIFKFKYQDVSVKLKKGSVIIFPPFWTHLHEVSDLENNTFRYTINTWSCNTI